MIDKEKLKKEFEDRAEKLRNTKVKIDNNQKLKFYGLYKVATVGKYSEKNKLKAGFFDFTTKYKNEAWEKCSVFSEEEAMIEYIQFYSEVTGEKLNLDFKIANPTKSISDITLDVPVGLESQGAYSSTAKETKENLDNYLKNASEEIKKFQSLKEQIYSGTIIIRNDANGNKHFYEINKIKEVDDISGTSLNRSFTYLSNNRLPSTQKNINSQPLQKYSIVNYLLNFRFLLLLLFCYVVKFLRSLKEFVNFRNFFHFR